MTPKVLFNRPSRVGPEMQYMSAALENNRIAGGGFFTQKVQEILERQLGVEKAFLTTSCTAALEMAALLLNIRPGDEVIVPSFTFVSVGNAFALRGARPVFADIRGDTLNIDEKNLERHINRRTKAIVVMHYAGIGCEMDAILELAGRHSLPVVEDNAHGLFGKYKDQFLGTFGCLATQSFHDTKNFTCGEGGALLLNQSEYVSRAEIVWEKGTNRLRFLRGQVEKYTWVDLGSSYLLADLLAAFLQAQLEARNEIQQQRKRVWQFYESNLKNWASQRGIGLPIIPAHTENPYHLFYLILKTSTERDRLIEHLSTQGIQSAFHYLPLHLSKMGRSFGGKEGDCPVCEDISQRLLRLPFHNNLSEVELGRVVAALECFPAMGTR
ncbi:MAG TPA: dTDP-4-amino-4,6-dideoxygalactose transaminase [Chthoniobacterales bacterium]